MQPDEHATTAPPTAGGVHSLLRTHMLTDGFPLVLDLARSQGARLVDAREGSSYLDLFTFFASNALGMNHPRLRDDPAFLEELQRAALHKPSNSDVFTVEMARFVATFARVLGDPSLPHLFFVEGGALAVENALKVAFDWKSRWNESRGRPATLGSKVLHLEGAFHGRSGYTLSLTNTDPVKTDRFPKFDWPRIPAPYLRSSDTPGDARAREERSLQAAREAFAAAAEDIACFIMEPIQGEGGDRHFTPEFLQQMQALCHEHNALFILDEVQTGCGLTGTRWCYEQLGLTPDVVAFGKKTQVCGIMAGGRVDEVDDNVFQVKSRINSTWGGSLVDMVRARAILEVVESEDLIARASERGEFLLRELHALAATQPLIQEVRGRGLMCALDLPDTRTRARVLADLYERENVILLGCGERSVRFRPALTISEDELREGLDALRRSLARCG